MRFSQRLAYYSLGLFFGIVAVIFVLGKKNAQCHYFPNERVLNDLRNKSFNYSMEASRKLSEDWIDTIDIKNTLKYGDVDFDKSNIKYPKGGKLYIIYGKTTKNDTITLRIINYPTKVELEDIIRNK